MNIIETITYRNNQIKIIQDEHCDSPDTWRDDECFLVYNYRDFAVSREGFDPEDIYESYIRGTVYKQYHVIPVLAYIHSGVRLSLDDGKPKDRWDTSFSGFCLIADDENVNTIELARHYAEQVISNWNDYLSGNVYGYETEDDSCWGYYGDWETSGLLDDAKAIIDYKIKKNTQNHIQRLKKWIKNKVNINYRTSLIL